MGSSTSRERSNYLPLFCLYIIFSDLCKGFPTDISVLTGRDVRRFVKTMLEDTGAYEGVIEACEGVMMAVKSWLLVDRGVSKRLIGDLQGALENLNLAFKLVGTSPQSHYNLFKQRGYVRHLMGNEEEAKKDAEAANQLKLQGLALEVEYNRVDRFWTLQTLPMEYLGFAL